MKTTYKGFVLTAAVEHLTDTDEWSTRVLVTKHHSAGPKEKFVSAANTYKDKAEAEHHSIEFGKQMIDGNYQGATVNDL
jgi:hypothetical protein